MKKTVIAVMMAFSTMAYAEEAQKMELVKCAKPVAQVRLGKLSCKAANCGSPNSGQAGGLAALLNAVGQVNMSGIGDGIKDMMTTAMVESGCFNVGERESIDELNEELKLIGKSVKVEDAAEFLITGSVTQIDVEKDTTNIGWGLIPVIGSIGTTKEKATVAMDLRLVNVNTAKIMDSKKITSSTENRNWGVGGLGGSSAAGIGFAGGFSSLKGTNLEAVTRDAVFQATNYMVAQIKKAKGIE